LFVDGAIDLDEGVEGGLGVGPGLGHPDLMECPLGLDIN